MEDMTLILDGTTVADGTFAVGVVEDWQAQPSVDAMDVSAPILVAGPAFIDLVTTLQRVVVSVGRSHASYRAALAFERQHRAAIGKVGDVSFGFTEDSVAWLCAYTDAKISPIQVSRTGVFTLTSYAIEFSGEPVITEGGSPPEGASLQVNAETASLSLSTAGTTTITLGAYVRERYERLTIGAGAGAYTRNIVLDIADREDGNVVDVMIAMPASANPTIRFYNASTGGTLLLTMPTDAGAAATYNVKFIYSESDGAWVLWDYKQLL